jgi:hypothetical protein
MGLGTYYGPQAAAGIILVSHGSHGGDKGPGCPYFRNSCITCPVCADSPSLSVPVGPRFTYSQKSDVISSDLLLSILQISAAVCRLPRSHAWAGGRRAARTGFPHFSARAVLQQSKLGRRVRQPESGAHSLPPLFCISGPRSRCLVSSV